MESSLAETLQCLEHSPAAYIKVARRIKKEFAGGLESVHAAFLSSYNLETTTPYLTVESARRDLELIPWMAPFGQIEQQILDPNSPIYSDERDVIVISALLEDVAPRAADRFLSLDESDLTALADEIVARFKTAAQQIRERSEAPILIGNFAIPRFAARGLAGACSSPGPSDWIARINGGLADFASEIPDVFIFDHARLVSSVGLRHWFDDKLAALARGPFGFEAQLAFSALLAKWFRALRRPPCKCLVLDLDNTLWGGVIGEDGIGGIRLGQDFPGNVFVLFQRYLLGLKDCGVLLAAASKNNEDDALAVFEKHPDCVLTIDDFSAMEIHWEDKATSIRNIAESLGIGLDAIAFFDDNPVERDWVQSQIPEVTVIAAPPDPIGYRDTIENSEAFDIVRFSAEDLNRSAMVSQDRKRESLSQKSQSIGEFLRGLEMVVTIGVVEQDTLTRVSQLVAKTNQFNLTTRRHSAAEIQKMIGGGAIALWMRLRDRFGDQGLIGVGIAVPDSSRDGSWRIDTFLLSCRVLMRKAETALLSALCLRVKERNGREIFGEYIPSGRNETAADLFETHGFTPDDNRPNSWSLDLKRTTVSTPDIFTLESPHFE